MVVIIVQGNVCGESNWKIGNVIGRAKVKERLMENFFQKYSATSMVYRLRATYVSLAADLCGEIKLMTTSDIYWRS